MWKLLVILVVIKLYARIDIFKQIKKKHGQNFLNVVRKYERLLISIMKIAFQNHYRKIPNKAFLVPNMK